MWSRPRLRRLCSHCWMMCVRERPRSLGPSPTAMPTLVAIRTSSMASPSASPRIRSDAPQEYTSAVSKRFTPASRLIATSSRASPTCVLPVSAKAPFPPNVIVPSVNGEIISPELPSVRYFIGSPQVSSFEFGLPAVFRLHHWLEHNGSLVTRPSTSGHAGVGSGGPEALASLRVPPGASIRARAGGRPRRRRARDDSQAEVGGNRTQGCTHARVYRSQCGRSAARERTQLAYVVRLCGVVA